MAPEVATFVMRLWRTAQGVPAAMRDRTAVTVRRALPPPAAQAGKRAPKAPAASGTSGASPLIQAPSGSLGLGGNGGDEQGGGGGGGCCGGDAGGGHGVGASGVTMGRGGGGSSLDPDGGSDPAITSDSPSITISYRTGGVGEPPPTTEQPQTKEECKKGGWKEFGFKNQGQCIKAVNHQS